MLQKACLVSVKMVMEASGVKVYVGRDTGDRKLHVFLGVQSSVLQVSDAEHAV